MINDRLFRSLIDAPARLLIFDFDGTLVDIASSPDKIEPDPNLPKYLDVLTRYPMTNIAVLSGRALDQLETYLSGLPNVALAGSHGASIRMPGCKKESLIKDDIGHKQLSVFTRLLAESVSGLSGIIIEEKEASVAMHYRLAQEKDALAARNAFLLHAKEIKGLKDYETLEGKMVLELRSKKVNKGLAVRLMCERILPSKDALVVYFGDDITDIDAFRALPSGSIRVAIGETISNLADYVLNSPQELLDLIRRFQT